MSLIKYDEYGRIIDDWKDDVRRTFVIRKPRGKDKKTAEQLASEQLAQRLAGNGGREDDSDDD